MRYALIPLLLAATAAPADPPRVIGTEARASGGRWTFSVTLDHPDTGWDHYADGWRVELADGTVLGERPLAHPHVKEMPFTRSQSGISIPGDVTEVFIRARCNVDGWAEDRAAFTLPNG